MCSTKCKKQFTHIPVAEVSEGNTVANDKNDYLKFHCLIRPMQNINTYVFFPNHKKQLVVLGNTTYLMYFVKHI